MNRTMQALIGGLWLALLAGCSVLNNRQDAEPPEAACTEPGWYGRLVLPGFVIGFGQGDALETARQQARADLLGTLRARIARECEISRVSENGRYSEAASCRTLTRVDGELSATRVLRQARCGGHLYVAEALDLRPLEQKLADAPGPWRLMDAGPEQGWRVETGDAPVWLRDEEITAYLAWQWQPDCPNLRVTRSGGSDHADALPIRDGDSVEAVFSPADDQAWALFHVSASGNVTYLGQREPGQNLWRLSGQARLEQMRHPEDELLVALPGVPSVTDALPAFSRSGRSARADLVRLERLMHEVSGASVCVTRYRIELPDVSALTAH